MDPILASLKALALSCHPLHWFFTFLFYTDVGSTTAVLATYFASLKRAYWISALMSLVAISFRQTNVVWTFFVLCVSILDFLYGECSGGAKLRLSVDKPLNQKLVRVAKKEYRTSGQVQGNGKKLFDIEDLLGEVLFILQHGWQKRVALMRQFFPFILPFLCFATFLVYNGSIVLGAKEAHKVSPHFTQLLYFSAFALLAMAPIHMDPFFIWTNLFSLFKFIHGRRGCFLIVLGGIVSCIHFFSFAHPYLVSDNRHYTFYMWRKIINVRWYSKYLLAIVYLYSWWSIFRLLGKKRNIWLMVFFGAVAAVLVPAPLIELRYYTIPLYIIALHTPLTLQNGYLAWMLLLLQNMCVNAVTMYIFLYRPFVTHSWNGPQRFIW
ncbi:hypothetical protein KP509_03G092100 [Ceratopteris richardii]|nr:hypothetical protein KP509_03G092100 [Ceratopteris richardii]